MASHQIGVVPILRVDLTATSQSSGIPFDLSFGRNTRIANSGYQGGAATFLPANYSKRPIREHPLGQALDRPPHLMQN